jgi:hypothetical protein
MKRQTLEFDDEVVRVIEDWRATQRPIPTFSDAVMTLIKNGAVTERSKVRG